MATLKVKLVRSVIGRPEKQHKIVKSLGLSKMNRERELPDNPAIRGQIDKIKHLVEVA
ncbi:50S ribosomal protein L30 [Magnetofaba australis]|uniref:Large ribosomal subunit protein uL30 n=1 Tax=Magnetofaba australis IT-1 TaxID=1434232 RepID=A0A1Y2K498_9PROT|nr:50S ribosomal protein L30 [Magnetofaba australis]OSM02466.1 putative 50S ribosomal protein L30 [Magnetofaba australis IT-1]